MQRNDVSRCRFHFIVIDGPFVQQLLHVNVELVVLLVHVHLRMPRKKCLLTCVNKHGIDLVLLIKRDSLRVQVVWTRDKRERALPPGRMNLVSKNGGLVLRLRGGNEVGVVG